MRFNLLLTLICVMLFTAHNVAAKDFYQHSAGGIDGTKVELSDYRGKTLLVVNTASECGFTYQLGDLQKLREKFPREKFEVLGFPSNDFGDQEPGSNSEIAQFCSGEFGVEFPLFEKAHVRGEAKQPIYEFLTTTGPEETLGEVRWNFEKFLVSPDGEVVARFPSRIEPLDDRIVNRISALIQE